MPILSILQQRSRLMPAIPHYIIINNQYVNVMQKDVLYIEMPEGVYEVRIQSMIKWFSSTQWISVEKDVKNILTFGDREKIWDALFVFDIILDVVRLIIGLPNPWNWIYQIFTNGYFAVWIIYEWCIRKHYFCTEFHHEIHAKVIF